MSIYCIWDFNDQYSQHTRDGQKCFNDLSLRDHSWPCALVSQNNSNKKGQQLPCSLEHSRKKNCGNLQFVNFHYIKSVVDIFIQILPNATVYIL